MKKYLSVRQTLPLQRSAAAFVIFTLLLTFFFFYTDRLQTVVRADTSLPVSLAAFGTAATENFDSLAASGTASTTPAGWGFSETGTNANTIYTAGTGSNNAGDTYSFGTGSNTDRAFGGLRSGSLVPIIGAAYTNNSGGTINSLAVSYTGEQWRLGATGRPDRMDFQISTDATSLSSGTWTNIDALDFTAPTTAGTVGALDGNAAANRTAITSTISGLTIPANTTFYLRWTDFDATGSDDGLAIDDFSLTPGGTVGGATNPSGSGTAAPNPVAAGGSVLLTVNVTPGSTPTSTNLAVTANLSAIGGSASQQFFDDGTNGDTVAGDNKFSYQAIVAGGTAGGTKSLPVTITDAQSRTGSTSIALTVTSNAPSASGAANPSSLTAGNTTLLTVSVTPGVNPASTGINVTGNLSAIGGSAAQTFLDDGMNGDVTAGDNTFSYQATVAAGTTSGTKSLPITVTDAQSRTGATTISLTVTTSGGTSGHNPQEHLVMGNPSGATADVNNPTNYLLLKDQYVMSYSRDRAIPNWVSWHLDSSWIGSAARQNDFRPDPALPSDWYHVTTTSYTGSGFDRGHHTPSGDRTLTVADNSATFLMSNMMPQAPGNNQGPWEKLETYCRTLVSQGNELYIIGAGTGTGGTGSNGFASAIDGGRVAVPSQTYKVILVLPVGDNDVSRVTTSTRTIAVIMPNQDSIRPDAWQKYLVSVDQVEALTGYDFFSNVAPSIQAVIEARVDGAANAAPTISAATGISRQQGNAASNSQIAIVSDADQAEDTLAVTVNGNSTATVNGVTVSGITIDASGSVTADIAAAAGATAAAFTLRVTDNQGAFVETAFNVAVTSVSYEADVQSRPGGDTFIDSDDIQQIRRFSVGLDLPYQSNEFQRADSAPRSTSGDGFVDSDDVQQARRYSVGLDAKQSAGGQTQGNSLVFEERETFGEIIGKSGALSAPLAPAATDVRVVNTTSSRGQQVTVPIRIDAQGNEAGFSFSLSYDATKLSNPVVTIGTAGGDVVTNVTAGNPNADPIGFSITSFSGGTIAAGADQLLVTVQFTVAANASAGTTPITFGDTPTRRKVSGTDPNTPLAQPTFTSGTVTIAAPTAADVSVGGRVVTASGSGIQNVTLSLLDSRGNVRTTRTTSAGYYEFPDVEAGTTISVTAAGKRFTFRQATQILSVTEATGAVNFIATPEIGLKNLPKNN